MKSILNVWLLWFMASSTFAQAENNAFTTALLHGTVSNELRQSIAGVTIAVLDANNNILANTVTEANGSFAFNVQKNTYYTLAAQLTDSNVQVLDSIQLSEKDLQVSFVFSTQAGYKRNKNTNHISATELEKMPRNNWQEQLGTKGNFDKDEQGNLRSRTLGNDVKIIVDGQNMSNSNLKLVPGSIGNLEVIKR